MSDAGGSHRLWGGRFATGPAPALEELNRSLPVDRRIWREDLEASRAWAEALVGAGVLDSEEGRRLDEGLARVGERLEHGIPEDAPDEDIHTLIERLLYEEAGDVAGKLHTGRSRNDQVATAFRLWALRAGRQLQDEIAALQAALVGTAEANVDRLMPAYTHLRRAQPVRVAHWILSHFWALERDRERVGDALRGTAVLPLGAAAVAGSAFPVDRERLRERLGFADIAPNSMDAVGDRDWVCELLFAATLCATHLSRLAEDLIVFSSDEFGFVHLPEAFTTGSSLLPQKRNPDGLELTRAAAARLLGDLTALLALLKGLPSGYQKDLQEDKALLFHGFDTLRSVLAVTRETVAGLAFDEERLRAGVADPGTLALDAADALVRAGVPFRDAHAAVGTAVRTAEERGVPLDRLTAEDWAVVHPAFRRTGPPALGPESSVEARTVAGGTARPAVLEQIRQARAALA